MRASWLLMLLLGGCGSMVRQAAPPRMPVADATNDTRQDTYRTYELHEERSWSASAWTRTDGSYEWGELELLRDTTPETRALSSRAATRSTLIGLLGSLGLGVVVGTATHELLARDGQDFSGATERALYISGASAFCLALILRFAWHDPRHDFADVYNLELRRALGLSLPVLPP